MSDSLQLEVIQPNAIESIARAEVDMAIATAKRYPRTLSTVKSDMLSFATLDEETAASCFYTLPRGGKTIQGPSVRLAEISVASYGNLKAASRVLSVDTTSDNPHVIVQAVCHDLQRNVSVSIEKRRRITKKKSKDTIDEDDINLACNACASIAFRDAVFKVVPLALIKPVYETAKQVAVGDVKSLVTKRTAVIDRLKKMGATEDRILAVVEARKVEDIDADKLQALIGLGTALKDGETTLEDAFPQVAVSGRIGQVTQPKQDPAPRSEEPTAPAETHEQPKAKKDKPAPKEEPAPANEGPTAEELRKAIVIELTKHNLGKSRLMPYLIQKGLAPEGSTWESLRAEELIPVSEYLPNIIAAILES